MMRTKYLDYILSVLSQRGTNAFLITYCRATEQDRWYFSDISLQTTPHVIEWTRSLSQAYKFDNQIDAMEFANDFMTSRNNIEVIRVDQE